MGVPSIEKFEVMVPLALKVMWSMPWTTTVWPSVVLSVDENVSWKTALRLFIEPPNHSVVRPEALGSEESAGVKVMLPVDVPVIQTSPAPLTVMWKIEWLTVKVSVPGSPLHGLWLGCDCGG